MSGSKATTSKTAALKGNHNLNVFQLSENNRLHVETGEKKLQKNRCSNSSHKTGSSSVTRTQLTAHHNSDRNNRSQTPSKSSHPCKSPEFSRIINYLTAHPAPDWNNRSQNPSKSSHPYKSEFSYTTNYQGNGNICSNNQLVGKNRSQSSVRNHFVLNNQVDANSSSHISDELIRFPDTYPSKNRASSRSSRDRNIRSPDVKQRNGDNYSNNQFVNKNRSQSSAPNPVVLNNQVDMNSSSHISDELIRFPDTYPSNNRASSRSSRDRNIRSPDVKTPERTPVTQRRARSHSKGLRNLGNSCYMNAVMQCLSRVPELQYLDSRNASDLVKSFLMLVRNMTSHQIDDEFCIFYEEIYKDSRKFANLRQNDAHSFLLYLLNSLKDTRTNFLDLFRGTTRTRIAQECCRNKETIHDESFLTLILPIPERSYASVEPITLKDCIDKYISSCETSDEDEYFCQKHQLSSKGQMTMKIHVWPRCLIIYFNRFNFKYNRKDNTTVTIPKELQLKDRNITYQLFALCNHLGSHIQFGHYTADVVDMEYRNWFHFDDACVNENSQLNNGEINSSDAVLIFYKKKK